VPSVSPVFGRIVASCDVAQRALDQLRLFMPDYLAEQERQRGLPYGTLERPVTYLWTTEQARWPEDELPAVLVLDNGFVASSRDEDGVHDATADIAVSVIVRGDLPDVTPLNQDGRVDTGLRVRYSAAAVRACVAKQVEGARWTGVEDFDDLPVRAGRTRAAGTVQFEIVEPSVLDDGPGPDEPTPDPAAGPPPDAPTPLTELLTVENRGVEPL
jgi:hypothetical protein